MSDYRIVTWTKDDIDPLVEVHHRAFHMDTDQSRRYLRWKYFSNPWLEPTLFVALNNRDEVVGMRGFYGSCWRADGRNIVVPCADDFAIAESHRNHGLMTEIMRVAIGELTARGHSQLLNLSGGHSTLLQSLAMGWVSIGAMKPVARFSRTLRVRRWFESRAVSQPFAALVPNPLAPGRAVDFARLDGALHGASGDGISISSQPRVAEMAALAEGQDSGWRVRHVRDAAWWNWRFENPMREYRYLFHERNGALDGYLVVHRTRVYQGAKLPYGIVDWEAESDDVRARMLSALISRGQLPAVESWSASMTAPETQLLAKSGFVDSDPEQRAHGLPCVLLKSLGAGAADALSRTGATWDIRLADSMHG